MNDKFVILRYNTSNVNPVTVLASVFNDEIDATISRFYRTGKISDADLNKKRITVQSRNEFVERFN